MLVNYKKNNLLKIVRIFLICYVIILKFFVIIKEKFIKLKLIVSHIVSEDPQLFFTFKLDFNVFPADLFYQKDFSI